MASTCSSILDSNSKWIAEELNKIGISVYQITSVQDDKLHILKALKEAEKNSDIIILTGGLGPTKDDITKKTIAEYFNDVLKLEGEELTETEKTFMLISKCMESIETEEENILLKDVSDAEVNDFIESLNTQQFGKVREYVENMPRVEKQIKFICGGCEKENNITLSGIDDFF